MTWEAYRAKARQMGAIVEAFIEGEEKRSPSVQFRIDPLGGDRMRFDARSGAGRPGRPGVPGLPLPGRCGVPAGDPGAKAPRWPRCSRRRGVLGRFGVDFVSVRQGDGWRNYAIEINLRKGGTTHPFLMLQFLTGGRLRSVNRAVPDADRPAALLLRLRQSGGAALQRPDAGRSGGYRRAERSALRRHDA